MTFLTKKSYLLLILLYLSEIIMNGLGNITFHKDKILDLQTDFDVIMTLKKEALWNTKISK